MCFDTVWAEERHTQIENFPGLLTYSLLKRHATALLFSKVFGLDLVHTNAHLG